MKIDDSELAIPPLSEVCTLCKHWRPAKGRTCDAYTEQDSIPMPIWMGENKHTAPYKGDHGIQFEPTNAAEVKAQMAKAKPRVVIDDARVAAAAKIVAKVKGAKG